MSFSQALGQQVQSELQKFRGPDLTDRRQFLDNLIFCYHVMVASENLLRVSADKATGDLKAYFTEHLDEEKDHEKWLADDLLTAGITVKATRIPTLACLMAGTLYYLVHHLDPVAQLGYMFVLERQSLTENTLALLERLHGSKLVRTLRYHQTHDNDHHADICRVIDGLPPGQQAIVHQVAVQTARYFGQAMAEISKSRQGDKLH